MSLGGRPCISWSLTLYYTLMFTYSRTLTSNEQANQTPLSTTTEPDNQTPPSTTTNPENQTPSSNTTSHTSVNQKRRNRKTKPNTKFCVPCGKIYSSHNGLYQHNKVHHSRKATIYRCDWCEKSYITKYRAEQHFKQLHPDGLTKLRTVTTTPEPVPPLRRPFEVTPRKIKANII